MNPVVYSDTTLNPDGTFILFDESHSWDRDWCYNWDSVVKISGHWTYDVNKRNLILTYESFQIDNDGKISDPSEFGLFPGKNITTNDFYFESNFIFALKITFSWGTPVLREDFSKKKII